MARFEDSPNLFGAGCGDSTLGEIICEVCGSIYNKGADDDDNENYDNSESVLTTDFAGLQVCECCFERIEDAVLARMDDILPWYKRIIAEMKKDIKTAEALLKGLPE